MLFALLTLLASFSVAGVSEWFSVVGIMTIYAGAPFNAALIMGLVLGGAKLMTISWLYRNWKYSSWALRAPLLYFMTALMIASSIGVFGFLTKSHLEQGAATVDNSAKIERLDQQIAREKSIIDDDQKVISQLDTAINSFLGNDKTDKALAVRRAQAPQRKQLKNEIADSQKNIDLYSDEKLKLTSQVRALQLEVGPIKYIADIFLGSNGNDSAKMEIAVRMFTLLIVSTLDPLAVVLLIAANHTLLRLQNEKTQKNTEIIVVNDNAGCTRIAKNVGEQDEVTHTCERTVFSAKEINAEASAATPLLDNLVPSMDEEVPPQDIIKNTINEEVLPATHIYNAFPELSADVSPPETTVLSVSSQDVGYAGAATDATKIHIQNPEIINEGMQVTNQYLEENANIDVPVAQSDLSIASLQSDDTEQHVQEEDLVAQITPVKEVSKPWAASTGILAELIGNHPHFVPQKINEEKQQKAQERPVEITDDIIIKTRHRAAISTEESAKDCGILSNEMARW